MVHTYLESTLDDMKQAIDKWFVYIGDKDAETIVKRTSLQVGIHDSALLEYAKGRATVTDIELDELDFDLDSPKGKTRSEELLSEVQVREQLVPQLALHMQQKLSSLPSKALIHYKFSFDGKFRTQEGEVKLPILRQVDQEKKEFLSNRITDYLSTKLETKERPTKPLETFFLSRHLLDEELFPELDAGKIITVFEKIQELNKGNKDKLKEHRANIVNALRDWVEEKLLPRCFDIHVKKWNQKEYTKKSDVDPESIDQNTMDLLLYTAVSIIKYEPAYSSDRGIGFLERAIELGSKKAPLLMKEGSGTFPQEVVYTSDEFVECKANDIFATVTISIKQESEESYARAIRFVCHLLRQGFPKSYQIKLKSSAKQFLPIKGLAKSATHRFFANAMQYPNLLPLLEEYAREAMEEFEWYGDTEGEKNCMPGTYAVFGLGLLDPCYFPLVEDYMKVVDEEHQSVQDYFTAAFIEKHGVNAVTMPTFVGCLLHGSDSMKLKIKKEMEDEENLRLLLERIRDLRPHEVEHIVFIIWGGAEKLKAIAAKAKGEKEAVLSEIVVKCERRRGV
ncbi:DUF6138 family protein [Brevibacillus sp. NRS-1366]|uniref:DUF6138 family protein n=1 Tax=Brevibacillus sp. NRS-1366 TaxID=3233899 RepID=UPI003D211615